MSVAQEGVGAGNTFVQSTFPLRTAAIALEKGCARMKWEVLDWNTPAIDFYTAMGAEFMDTWRNVRLSGEALRRLAYPADGAAADPRQPVAEDAS